MMILKKLMVLTLACAACGATQIDDTNPWDNFQDSNHFPSIVDDKCDPYYLTYRHCEDRDFDPIQNMIYHACSCMVAHLEKDGATMHPDRLSFIKGKIDAYIDVYIWIDELKDGIEYQAKPCASPDY